MEIKDLTAILVVAMVGCVLVAGFIPVVGESVTATTTFVNNGAFYVEVDPADTYTIEYDKSAEAGVVYINDEPLNVAFSTGYTILAIDNAILRLQSGDSTIQYKGNGVYITGIKYLDITVSNGSITGSFQTPSNESPLTWPETTYTECYIASTEKQDWIMSTYTDSVKMLGDSHIHAFGQTVLTTEGSPVTALIKIDGNISDGVDVSVLNATTGEEYATATIDDLSINATAVNGYLNLYDLTSITFKAKILDTDGWTNVSYSAYIVPASVTAEKAIHADENTASMIAMIPFILIMGIVLMFVGVVLVRRYV